MIRLGFETKTNFAKSRLLSRSTVTKFFNFQPIQVDTFKKICDELELNWRETAEISGDETPVRLEKSDCSRSESNEGSEGDESMQMLRRQVTVLDKDSQETKVVITLEGDINSAPNLKLLESALKTYSGHTIKILDIQAGSIKLIVEGSQEDIEKLLSNFQSGEIKELNGFPVEDIQVLSESSEDEENDKWRLVEDIVRQEVKNRKLSDADLSDADLSGANLGGADLSDANLSDADLSGADLSGADLIFANLSGADLIRANLIRANLSGADLISANLSGADLISANLSGADLSGADLRDANLSSADLILANLSDANLSSADLSGADLILANLSDANLSSANWSGANLISADLSDADLREANLSGADLREANLSGADLREANLSGADLREANLSGANVKQAKFGKNSGLTEEMKLDLERRGAIFEDSPGDRSRVLSLR
ncbi:Pentapeptide repeat protein [Coleofasciculus chthonoplastes PCC 7420]|uniref:Pentapeptide repeat protein n=1 Tax=Coleofasciculus chthonoplastes PCC 7420 TaxID=118168 RepID=B4W5E6_9CYAN|nr:Pentapeptide repeat protein [Coleofasciculus chthonoplastes PCC 7420]